MQRRLYHAFLCFTLVIGGSVLLKVMKLQFSLQRNPLNMLKRDQQGLNLFVSQRPETKEKTETKDESTETTWAFDDAVSFNLSKKIRLACFITTRELNMDTKLRAVNETWGKRCDKMLYVMTSNKTQPDILALNVSDSRDTLTEKVRVAFTHMRKHLLDHFDWFMKADDDTYVIVENLKFFLSHFDTNEPVVVGDHYKDNSLTGYMQGGAGYVLSKEALRRLVDDGYNVPGKCCQGGGNEDIETARCLDKVGVPKFLSLDKYNRSTFHGSKPEVFIANLTSTVNDLRVNKFEPGLDCCSQIAISFHRIHPDLMLVLEFFIYRVSVFGRSSKYTRLMDMFKVQKADIPHSLWRRGYPTEKVAVNYNNATKWRQENATILSEDLRKKFVHVCVY